MFIFGCTGSLLMCAGFSLVVASGGFSSVWYAGFSLLWLLLFRSTGSRMRRLQLWLNFPKVCGVFIYQGLNQCSLH